MSNSSLISRIETSLLSVRSGESNAKSLAETVRGNGRALESMPYPLITEMENLVMDLQIASWDDEEGLLPDMATVLERLEAWLSKLPRDVS